MTLVKWFHRLERHLLTTIVNVDHNVFIIQATGGQNSDLMNVVKFVDTVEK